MKWLKKAKITVTSLALWILACISFLGAAKWGIKPDNFYQDRAEITFLVSAIIGVVSFIVFCLSLLLKLWLRSKLLALLIFVLTLIFPLMGGAFVYGMIQNQNQISQQAATIPTFTGQDVFDAVNKYRVANGSPEVTLDPVFCNNLAQRYYDLKSGVSEGVAHKSFEEWVKKYIFPIGNYSVSEDYAWGKTTDDVIKAWDSSPGHRLSILDKSSIIGCSYAAEGHAVIELGHKVN